MLVGTLGRYFAGRFIGASAAVFGGIFALIVLIDYIDMTRKMSGVAKASAFAVAQASFFRVPQLLEILMPFCVLIGTMSCYLALSRRLELVVARSAGISAWQFVTPALLSALAFGVLATTLYNPLAVILREQSKKIETELSSGERAAGLQVTPDFWLNQVTNDGQSIISALFSAVGGTRLAGISVFRWDPQGRFKERIEAREATLEGGRWVLKGVQHYQLGAPPVAEDTYLLPTNLTSEQVRDSSSSAETVSFWQLPEYIASSEHSKLAAAGYRLQYHKLIARPFLLAGMVLLASAVSLRFFRLGGVQKMVLSGVIAGFLLYVLQKVTEDLSKADLLNPIVAAWLPVCFGGLTGLLALLYQEDG